MAEADRLRGRLHDVSQSQTGALRRVVGGCVLELDEHPQQYPVVVARQSSDQLECPGGITPSVVWLFDPIAGVPYRAHYIRVAGQAPDGYAPRCRRRRTGRWQIGTLSRGLGTAPQEGAPPRLRRLAPAAGAAQ